MEELGRLGHRIEVVGVDDGGHVDEGALDAVLRRSGPPPTLASFQWANQETGILLPIGAIAEKFAAAGIPLHVDSIQAAGKLPIDLSATPISLLSLSGHKLGGPKGTGVLVVRKGVSLHPLLFGGGQEGGLRPGTEDVAGAIGFAGALELAVTESPTEAKRLTGLRSLMEEGLLAGIPDLRVHGARAPRVPHILAVGVPGIARDLLLSALDLAGVGASAGSACRSGSTEVSPVMLGLYGEAAHTFAPLRLSLGWSTTLAEVEEAIPQIVRAVERIRAAGVGVA
jgi:cysteine desulfurase